MAIKLSKAKGTASAAPTSPWTQLSSLKGVQHVRSLRLGDRLCLHRRLSDGMERLTFFHPAMNASSMEAIPSFINWQIQDLLNEGWEIVPPIR